MELSAVPESLKSTCYRSFDALTSDRPYRQGLPVDQTIAMLREKSGFQFDPDVIEAFTAMMSEQVPRHKATAASGESR